MNTERTDQTKNNCVVYARVARNEGDALKRQIDAVTAFAAEQGFHVVAVFADSGDGTKAIAERSGLAAAMEAIEEGAAATLVVRDLDRIARDYPTFREVGRRLKQQGATLHLQTLNGPVDPTEPLGQLLFGLVSYDREVVRKRTMQGIKRRYENAKETA